MVKVWYADDYEKNQLIQTYQSQNLATIEEGNTKEGNYLVFDSPSNFNSPTPSIEERISVLEETTNFLLGLEVV